MAHTRRENYTPQKTSKRLTRPNAHRWTYLGDKKLVQAVKGSEVYIMDLMFWAREIVKQCKVCHQVNANAAKSKQGKRPSGERPAVYWEVDFYRS